MNRRAEEVDRHRMRELGAHCMGRVDALDSVAKRQQDEHAGGEQAERLADPPRHAELGRGEPPRERQA